jgi:hypothetical protein
MGFNWAEDSRVIPFSIQVSKVKIKNRWKDFIAIKLTVAKLFYFRC